MVYKEEQVAGPSKPMRTPDKGKAPETRETPATSNASDRMSDANTTNFDSLVEAEYQTLLDRERLAEDHQVELERKRRERELQNRAREAARVRRLRELYGEQITPAQRELYNLPEAPGKKTQSDRKAATTAIEEPAKAPDRGPARPTGRETHRYSNKAVRPHSARGNTAEDTSGTPRGLRASRGRFSSPADRASLRDIDPPSEPLVYRRYGGPAWLGWPYYRWD